MTIAGYLLIEGGPRRKWLRLNIPLSVLLPIFKQFCSSGILSVVAGIKPTRAWVSSTSSFSMIRGVEIYYS